MSLGTVCARQPSVWLTAAIAASRSAMALFQSRWRARPVQPVRLALSQPARTLRDEPRWTLHASIVRWPPELCLDGLCQPHWSPPPLVFQVIGGIDDEKL